MAKETTKGKMKNESLRVPTSAELLAEVDRRINEIEANISDSYDTQAWIEAKFKEREQTDEGYVAHYHNSRAAAVREEDRKFLESQGLSYDEITKSPKKTKRPVKKSPKKALAQKKAPANKNQSNGTGPKPIARNTRGGGIEY